MKDIIIDTLLDSVKLLPFLLVAFLIIETIEHKLSDKSKKLIGKSGKFGPIVGGLLGVIPQCGFSVVVTNLYVTRIVSLGTLMAVYLSTSDEMLPVLIANNGSKKEIIFILLIKLIVGILFGYIVDLIIRNRESVTYDICEDEHCGCKHEHSLLKSSLRHTLKTFFYILVFTFIINIAFTYLGESYLSKLLMKDSVVSPFITSLIGLIPTCGASIMISELYLNGVIGLGSTVSGLLTGSGVALLVLFKSNKNIKENIKIVSMLYAFGALCGLIIEIVLHL